MGGGTRARGVFFRASRVVLERIETMVQGELRVIAIGCRVRCHQAAQRYLLIRFLRLIDPRDEIRQISTPVRSRSSRRRFPPLAGNGAARDPGRNRDRPNDVDRWSVQSRPSRLSVAGEPTKQSGRVSHAC